MQRVFLRVICLIKNIEGRAYSKTLRSLRKASYPPTKRGGKGTLPGWDFLRSLCSRGLLHRQAKFFVPNSASVRPLSWSLSEFCNELVSSLPPIVAFCSRNANLSHHFLFTSEFIIALVIQITFFFKNIYKEVLLFIVWNILKQTRTVFYKH